VCDNISSNSSHLACALWRMCTNEIFIKGYSHTAIAPVYIYQRIERGGGEARHELGMNLLRVECT